jgi:fructokinase
MTTLSQSVVSTAGEALIDLVAQADGTLLPCLGGAVYNMTRALAKQGVPTCYLNPFSSDRFGTQLRQQIVADGVLLAHPAAEALPTALAVVNVNEQGKADYAFYRDGVADRQISAAMLTAATTSLPHLQIVATGCLALAAEDQERYLPWLVASRAAGKTVVVDANLRTIVMKDLQAYRASVRAALQQAHIIKVSDDDLDDLNGCASGSSDHLAMAKLLFADTPAQWIALTLGAKGAYLLHRDGRTWFGRETAQLSIVDTVGAGDCFLAGMLAAWLEGPDAENMLRRAISSASLCVEQRGCTPATALQIRQHMARGTIEVRATP